MKKLIFAIFIIVLYLHSVEMMTEAQMKSTTKLMRNVCQPKTKATNAQINNMRNGEFADDEKFKCYLYCVLQMMKAMKNGKLEFETILKEISTLPQRYQEPTRKTIETCKNSITSSEQCQAGYDLAKCMYITNPEFYFIP